MDSLVGAAKRTLKSLEQAPLPKQGRVKQTAVEPEEPGHDDGGDPLLATETPKSPKKKQPQATSARPKASAKFDADKALFKQAQALAPGGMQLSGGKNANGYAKGGMVKKDKKHKESAAHEAAEEKRFKKLGHVEADPEYGESAEDEAMEHDPPVDGYADGGGPDFDDLERDLPSATRGAMPAAEDSVFDQALKHEGENALRGLLGRAAPYAGAGAIEAVDPLGATFSPNTANKGEDELLAREHAAGMGEPRLRGPLSQVPLKGHPKMVGYKEKVKFVEPGESYAHGGDVAPMDPEMRDQYLAQGFAHELKRHFPEEMAHEHAKKHYSGGYAKGGRAKKHK